MRPELLAPAGSPDSLRAAVQSGAGAVYLGWGTFNARQSAKNFSDEEFADALVYCHQRGVRVFLTLNTLLTDRELPQALDTARTACRLGVDAVLVQDWGLLRLLRTALPDLPIHASTQMSIFTSGAAAEAAADGCERVVLAREYSAEDTAAVCRTVSAEVEVFGHGALCMCYSGQCAMSALIGGRSGNRGRCAQPCRLPYGIDASAGKARPLSLKDSCLAGDLEEMADMGVSCVKLEGRMKRAEYVAVVTGIYARLLEEGRGPTAEEQAQLEQAFSRSGFTDDYWRGRHGPKMFGSRPENVPEPAGLFAAARAVYEKDAARLVDVDFACAVRAGAPSILTARDRDGHAVTVTGPVPEPARTRALTEDELRARLEKTGGTGYRCASADTKIEGGLSLPASAINALRRDALAALTAARTAPPVRRELAPPPLPEADCAAPAPDFTVSLTGRSQLTEALLDLSPAWVSLPLEELSRRSALPESGVRWAAVLPRVWRDRDEPQLRGWLRHARDLGVGIVLAGNLGHLPLARDSGLEIRGDYGLNVFNAQALAYLREKGLSSACLSFELRFSQIRDMAKALPAEAIVYGRLPLMITENCLVQNHTGCRLDRGGPAVPDGAPCRSPHELRDRTGAAFPLLGAYGHRTEIQNSRPLYLADRPAYRQLGLTFARLRFTTESPEECVRIFRAYREGQTPDFPFTRGLYERGVQ